MLTSAFFWKEKRRKGYSFADFLRIRLYIQKSVSESLSLVPRAFPLKVPWEVVKASLWFSPKVFSRNQKLITCWMDLPLPFHNLTCRGNHAFLSCSSFLKTVTVPVAYFPVTSPVSKTFASLGLVLRAHFPSNLAGQCWELNFMQYMYNVQQIAGRVGKGERQ